MADEDPENRDVAHQGEGHQSEDIDPRVIEFLHNTFNQPSGDFLVERIGDGLNRDGLLKFILEAIEHDPPTNPEEAQEHYESIAHYKSLLSQQPPFRLELTDEGHIHLVLTLGNRIVQSWTPSKPESIDDELIALLGESLRHHVGHHKESNNTYSVASRMEAAKSELRMLTGPDDAGILERAKRALESLKRAVDVLLPRRAALQALKKQIGAGKSRDDLLESALPDLPASAQQALAEKLNEQPPFQMECEKDGTVHLTLIGSGERAHTWSPKDLGVPAPMWRKVVYGIAGLWVVILLFDKPYDDMGWGELIVAGALPFFIFALADGYFFLKRTKGRGTASMAYWAAVALILVIGVAEGSELVIMFAVFMGIGRSGQLWNLWAKNFGGDLLLECPNCGALTTRRAYKESAYDSSGRLIYRCAGCGTMEPPVPTGRRATNHNV